MFIKIIYVYIFDYVYIYYKFYYKYVVYICFTGHNIEMNNDNQNIFFINLNKIKKRFVIG